ncbi:MAG: hypothetical protein KIS78_28760 [Labilithrix sp.]|nr:hypothetical protein [Labilithrix sp.]
MQSTGGARGTGAYPRRSDAKRLCPAFGTTKRKGAPGLAEWPHRRTTFVCAGQDERLDEAALDALVQALHADFDDEGRARRRRAERGNDGAPPNPGPVAAVGS